MARWTYLFVSLALVAGLIASTGCKEDSKSKKKSKGETESSQQTNDAPKATCEEAIAHINEMMQDTLYMTCRGEYSKEICDTVRKDGTTEADPATLAELVSICKSSNPPSTGYPDCVVQAKDYWGVLICDYVVKLKDKKKREAFNHAMTLLEEGVVKVLLESDLKFTESEARMHARHSLTSGYEEVMEIIMLSIQVEGTEECFLKAKTSDDASKCVSRE